MGPAKGGPSGLADSYKMTYTPNSFKDIYGAMVYYHNILETWVLFYDGGPAKFIPRFYAVLIGTQSL